MFEKGTKEAFSLPSRLVFFWARWSFLQIGVVPWSCSLAHPNVRWLLLLSSSSLLLECNLSRNHEPTCAFRSNRYAFRPFRYRPPKDSKEKMILRTTAFYDDLRLVLLWLTAFSVLSSSSNLFIRANSDTFSCGKNWHKLATWIFKLLMSSSTSLNLLVFSLIDQSLWLLRWITRLITKFFPFLLFLRSDKQSFKIGKFRNCLLENETCTYSSISIVASFLPYLMKSHTFPARPSTTGLPPIPKQIAHTTVDLPVPFGPIITFKLGPGMNSNES